jgi:hypothetical protein
MGAELNCKGAARGRSGKEDSMREHVKVEISVGNVARVILAIGLAAAVLLLIVR